MHRQSFFLVPLICLSSALWAAPATVNVEVLQDKLDHPWALAFLPDNHGMLITLRGGELRHWQAGKGLSAPLSGVPDVLGARAGRSAGRGFSARFCSVAPHLVKLFRSWR